MVAWPAGNISAEATTSRGNTIYEATRHTKPGTSTRGLVSPADDRNEAIGSSSYSGSQAQSVRCMRAPEKPSDAPNNELIRSLRLPFVGGANWRYNVPFG
jgi:hypothetical protein